MIMSSQTYVMSNGTESEEKNSLDTKPSASNSENEKPPENSGLMAYALCEPYY